MPHTRPAEHLGCRTQPFSEAQVLDYFSGPNQTSKKVSPWTASRPLSPTSWPPPNSTAAGLCANLSQSSLSHAPQAGVLQCLLGLKLRFWQETELFKIQARVEAKLSHCSSSGTLRREDAKSEPSPHGQGTCTKNIPYALPLRCLENSRNND